jgi:mycothiol synthase
MDGMTTAPLVPRDGPAVARVWRACEIHDDGEALLTEEDFAASCRRPSMDLRRDSIGVRDGGELVALALLGASVLIAEDDLLWVAQLAVVREHRARGLGRALLVHAFGVAWRAGLRHVGLSTDSRTGARGLYEHVGMRVTRTSWEYAKLLR